MKKLFCVRRIGIIVLFSCVWVVNAHEDQKPRAPKPARSGPIAEQYRSVAEKIIQSTLTGHQGYDKLERLCDDIGHRLSGSPQLEKAIAWAVETLRKDGHENVRAEKVMVPHWVRGQESLTMIQPRHHSIVMLGLGGSVGTPSEGITASVVVVRDEQELEAMSEQARGKIILFNNVMPPYDPDHGTGYGTAVRFRSKGAKLTSEKGAVACLIRSVTANGLRTPHTGAMNYDDVKVKIPAAAITGEDADLIARLVGRGQNVSVTLKMEAQTLEPAPSANIIAEIRGSTWPDQVVVMGGHIDSWDVGQGAHDDAGGCVIAMEALNVLRKLNLTPKRTIRVVLWTNEENGLMGAKNYAETHAQELANHVAAIEADSGVFAPRGYSVECMDSAKESAAADQLRDITNLFSVFGANQVSVGGSGADVGAMKPAGVVLMGHNVDVSRYFDYHHSPADTLDKIKPEDLTHNIALLAATAYILADMPQRLGEVNSKP